MNTSRQPSGLVDVLKDPGLKGLEAVLADRTRMGTF